MSSVSKMFVLSETEVYPTLMNVNYKFCQDCPPFTGLPEYIQLVAGASLSAVNMLRRDKVDVAICWDGGRSFFIVIRSKLEVDRNLGTMHKNLMPRVSVMLLTAYWSF